MVGLDHRARIRWGSSRRSADSTRRGRGGEHDLQRKVDEVVERLAVGVVAHSRPAQLVGAEIDGIAVGRHFHRRAVAPAQAEAWPGKRWSPASPGGRGVSAAARAVWGHVVPVRLLVVLGQRLGVAWRSRSGCATTAGVGERRRGPGQASVGGRWGPACRANGETAPQTSRSLSPYESRSHLAAPAARANQDIGSVRRRRT